MKLNASSFLKYSHIIFFISCVSVTTSIYVLLNTNTIQDELLYKKAFAPITFIDGIPSILIIGDSISIGYTPALRELMAGKANISRPSENSQSSRTIKNKLNKWLGHRKWDIIYFNAGLHDIKHVSPDDKNKIELAPTVDISSGTKWVSIDEYKNNIEVIAQKLKSTGAKIIFATTTPAPSTALGRHSSDVIKYNKAAIEILNKHGIQIDDLFTFIIPQLEIAQRPNDVHFNNRGRIILAHHIHKTLSTALKEKEPQATPLQNRTTPAPLH